MRSRDHVNVIIKIKEENQRVATAAKEIKKIFSWNFCKNNLINYLFN